MLHHSFVAIFDVSSHCLREKLNSWILSLASLDSLARQLRVSHAQARGHCSCCSATFPLIYHRFRSLRSICAARCRWGLKVSKFRRFPCLRDRLTSLKSLGALRNSGTLCCHHGRLNSWSLWLFGLVRCLQATLGFSSRSNRERRVTFFLS